MTSKAFEALLAQIYVDEAARAEFIADPHGAAARAGLTPSEADALTRIDRIGLELAARSFARKRALKEAGAARRSFWRRLARVLRGRSSAARRVP